MSTATQSWSAPAPDTKPKAENIRVRAELQWAALSTKNKMSDKYQTDLIKLSEEAAQKLSEAGIQIKTKADEPEKGLYVTCSSKNEIHLYGEDGNRILAPAGNGTEVIATIEPYAWTYQNKKGISPSLRKLVATKFIEYVPEDAPDDDSPVF